MIFALIALSGFITNYSVRAEILEAQWEAHQIKFHYSGFSTHYTCDGIEHKVKRLLKLFGARDDARIENTCLGHSRIQRFHRMRLAFSTPVPADKTDISREIIPAEWQEVRIVGKLSRYLNSGDCELVEQFQRQVLSHLQVRNSKNRLHCIPYHHALNNLRLRMSALKVLEKPELEERRDDSQIDTR